MRIFWFTTYIKYFLMYGYGHKHFADYIYFRECKKILHPQATLNIAT